ncbi:putative glycosyltransferase [Burkholderia sp. Ch1-1]|uniref:glycosyltransferase family 2 protein n=1 Tax=Paraburkholderia sp. USG1 TaxID=2952268 RepID=UPI0001D235F8|nr:glycosyltransferase family 2 protein [Paraburkholderia sp. USG1]EIF33761.1 putative glycosyltransferase [Burkholderia sp. Ch1-1]MDR8400853.1 glycosyltransferase family 2 protein [Paraburkholderia sp. USG1]
MNKILSISTRHRDGQSPAASTSTDAHHVAVVLVNYKNARDTLRCIESLGQLDYGSYSIVVVDNCSGDGSYERFKELEPSVKVIRSDSNDGFAAACNMAMNALRDSAVKYFWLLNNDTVVRKDTLSELVAVAEQSDAIGAVGSRIVDLHDSDKTICAGGGVISRITGRSMHVENFTVDTKLDYLCGASCLIRRDAYEDIGPLSEKYFLYWEDADYSFRLAKKNWSISFADKSIVMHAESNTVGKGSPRFDYFFSRGSVIFLRSHFKYHWVVPLLVSLSGRLARRVIRGNYAGAVAIATGVAHGLSGQLRRPN